MVKTRLQNIPPILYYEILGWYGALAIVGSYVLITIGVMQAHDLSFQLLNLTGGLAVAWIAWHKRVAQPVFINLFRAGAAFIAVIAILFS